MKFNPLRRIRGIFGSPEDFLLSRVDLERIPRHVAVIMDGNGRWAARRGLPTLAGHRVGAEAIRRTIRAAVELGVAYLTIYTFSVENWGRPREEVEGLMRLFEENLARELPELEAQGVRINVLGRLEDLPGSTREAFLRAAEKTKNNHRLLFNIALNYGGRAELVDAARKLAGDVAVGRLSPDGIDEAAIEERLYTAGMPPPELLIRTSGEMRVSNFLLWQIAYTEIWVTPTLWPDFGRDEFLTAIIDYQGRRRRFGGREST